MRNLTNLLLLAAASVPLAGAGAAAQDAAPTVRADLRPLDVPRQAGRQWSERQVNACYAEQPFMLGANYTTSSAINQLEMFQADTFDPKTIDRELGWAAEKFGMNVMRIYLHDLLWADDPEGLVARFDQVLAIADSHGIRVMPVLFDSVWNPDPKLGPQHAPIPGIHNSGWLQSPGRDDLIDASKDSHFEAYVKGIVSAFGRDPRVVAWDLWNEPDNPGGGSYNGLQLPEEEGRIAELVPKTFAWAREAKPAQPLTSGLWWGGDWSKGSDELTPVQRSQIELSDLVTFHNYEWPEEFERRVAQLRTYGRPLVNTEWMARGNGSTVDTILPLAVAEDIGMVNWGLVDGKIQTRFPWDSWEGPYVLQEPRVWFHDLMHADGEPYREREREIFERAARDKGIADGD